MTTTSTHDWQETYGAPTLAVVISDFGRAAALRFALALAEAERHNVSAALPPGTPFMDEYRRTSIVVSGDLRYIKEPLLAAYRGRGVPLDEGILVGFEGGPTAVEVAPRLGVLLLEALAGPLDRGFHRVEVLLPCNTLAPASRWLEDRFAEAGGGIERLLAEAGSENRRDLQAVAERLGDVELSFPTVPAAAMAAAERAGGDAVLPLGTAGVPAEYEVEADRLGARARPVTVLPEWQRAAYGAITASISGDVAARQEAEEAILRVRAEATRTHGEGLRLVEACTDLDYGVGLDSTTAYAEAVVRRVYG